jgi:UDP-N-acetylmuramate dehydrogenase
VIFKLKKEKRELVKKRAQEALAYRKKTQPFGVFSSGCFFQNISEKEKLEKKLPTTSSGYLIDKAGLKNFSIGDFYISPIHANFIINKGNGKKEDLKKLLETVKKKVKEKFGIELKEEVIKI